MIEEKDGERRKQDVEEMERENVVKQVQAVRNHPGERAAQRIETEVVSRQLMACPCRPRLVRHHGLQGVQVEKGRFACFGLVPDLPVIRQGNEAPEQESDGDKKPGTVSAKRANPDRAFGHFTSSACGPRDRTAARREGPSGAGGTAPMVQSTPGPRRPSAWNRWTTPPVRPSRESRPRRRSP